MTKLTMLLLACLVALCALSPRPALAAGRMDRALERYSAGKQNVAGFATRHAGKIAAAGYAIAGTSFALVHNVIPSGDTKLMVAQLGIGAAALAVASTINAVRRALSNADLSLIR